MHVVPNSEIKVVSNKTRGWSRAVVDVGVPYDENVDRALEVLRDEAAQFSTDKAWGSQLDGPVEVLGVESLSDSAVVLRTMIRTQPGSQWTVAREFRRRIKNRFDREKPRDSVPAAPSARAGRRRPGGHRSRSLTPRPGPPADEPPPLQHAHPPRRAVRPRSSRGGCRSTPAGPRSTTTPTSGTSGRSCSRTSCAAGSRPAGTRCSTS